MNLNPAAILALISDLYTQVGVLTEENAKLREALAEKPAAHAGTVQDPDPCPPMGETRVQHV